MIYIRAASLFWILGLISASRVPKITRHSGEDAILECKGDKRGDFTVVRWTKSDLKDKYVFLQVDSHIESENQHPSFKNRVDLQDRQMKDGDMSLILKNVTTNDSGTYVCQVKTQTNRRKRANLEPISTIYLSVSPPGSTGGTTEDGVSRGHSGLVAGISVFVMLVAAMSVFAISKRLKKKNPFLPAPPDKEAEQQQV